MLSPEKAAEILNVVERDLLTPLGLRTLSPHDPHIADAMKATDTAVILRIIKAQFGHG